VIIEDIEGFSAALPPRRALIGLDLGTKTIGVAVSDTLIGIATPVTTVPMIRAANPSGNPAAIEPWKINALKEIQ